nr:reverse transcriptase domain-containing protein [Tanacetum cinerariifolium]
MHGVNNPELIKRLNEHVSKTLEEIMTITVTFIRGKAAATSKKKVHTSWKSHDQPKRQNSERRSDFKSQPRDGRGSNKFTPLTRMPKEIFAAESGKFKPPPPMVTLVEKRSSNKFCEFHNDKGHITDECVQLRKHIEELRVTRQKVTQSFAQVKEITFLPLAAHKGTGAPIVIEAKISGHAVHRIYVDGGSSMEVLYEHCFNRLWPEIKSQMVPATMSLTGFSGETIWPLRQLRLLVTIEDAENYTRAWMNFMIVRSPSPYNGIIGRHEIREIQAVPSTAHGMLKFPMKGGIGQAPEHAKAIQVEVQKLVEAGILREVYYHDWLSNPVMVKKHNRSWRMCVDFTDLNKACPHDCYPLPEIDWKVKSLYDYPFKCFSDAYKGYHQIQMAKQDEEKTAFHASHGVYCYTKMPFGLKNAGATYQRLVDKAFDKQVGRNLEIYVDDLVIKSHTETELLWDIEETFRTLRRINMKLNLKMYVRSSRRNVYRIRDKSGRDKICDFDDRKRHNPNTGLLCEPSTAYSRAKLYPNGKASPDASLRILSGASHRGHHRPAHQACDVTFDVVGRLQKWSVMLGEYNITYRPWTSVKGQILVDFHVEKPNDAPPEASVIETPQELWTLFTNGSSYGTLLGDRKEVSKLCIKARQYELWEGVLYRRSFLKSWLRCVGPLQEDYVIREIHEGSCRKFKFLIVAMDYFTKWMEVKAVATITDGQVKKFIWDNIVCRFGLPGEIVSDNGKQFSDNMFKDWCEKFNIIQRFASVKHPQSNGLVERANRSLGEGIMARLGEANKNWIEELLYVLWAHRTMIKSSHGDTPFSLTYGTEAFIPAKIRMPTFRTTIVDAIHNNEELRLNLDLLEEQRECATIREAKEKLKMTKYYNSQVRGVTFRPGDFFIAVMRQVMLWMGEILVRSGKDPMRL